MCNGEIDIEKDKKTYIDIVEYLNKKTGANYKYSTKSTQKHIKARLKEGFTVEDFKTVIDTKCNEWNGTNMQQYLRPETLFGTKFEGYLNSANKTKQAIVKQEEVLEYKVIEMTEEEYFGQGGKMKYE